MIETAIVLARNTKKANPELSRQLVNRAEELLNERRSEGTLTDSEQQMIMSTGTIRMFLASNWL